MHNRLRLRPSLERSGEERRRAAIRSHMRRHHRLSSLVSAVAYLVSPRSALLSHALACRRRVPLCTTSASACVGYSYCDILRKWDGIVHMYVLVLPLRHVRMSLCTHLARGTIWPMGATSHMSTIRVMWTLCIMNFELSGPSCGPVGHSSQLSRWEPAACGWR